ncbi:MAG: hypothetical protein N3G76_01405 [Candidatus Micrarchaeota archaeon]|nr:hypothetical protein [Candidatus Micrarchaeota archaeon]
MQKTSMVLLILVIVASFTASAAGCKYTPQFNVTSSSVTTLFPTAGDEIELHLAIESTEVYAGEAHVYLQKGGLKYPLAVHQEYIVPGKNELAQEIRIPGKTRSGVYMLYVEMDGFVYSLPLIINGSAGEDNVIVEEDGREIKISVATEGPVIARQDVVLVDGRKANKEYKVEPVNGIASVSEQACADCKETISLAYDSRGVVIERVYGNYEEPYVRITGLARDKLELETCAASEYEVYVNGESKGKMKGIGNIEVPLQNGYETVRVQLMGKGELLERSINLGEIKTDDVRISVQVVAQQPFTIQITAKDAFGRDVLSSGEIAITDENGRAYYDKVSFMGTTQRKYNLAKGKYVVSYNGVSTSGDAIPEPPTPAQDTHQRFELVPSDLVPVVAGILVLAVVVAIMSWLKGWKRNI